MTDVKVRASFTLPGSVLPAEYTQLKKEKRKEKKRKKEKKEKEKNPVSYHNENFKIGRETFVIKIRDAKSATQTIQINKDGYESMIDPTVAPYGVKLKMWGQFTKSKRLRYHLNLIANDLGGTLASFVILED